MPKFLTELLSCTTVRLRGGVPLPTLQFVKVIFEIFLAFLCGEILLQVIPFLVFGDAIVSLKNDQQNFYRN